MGVGLEVDEAVVDSRRQGVVVVALCVAVGWSVKTLFDSQEVIVVVMVVFEYLFVSKRSLLVGLVVV